MAGDRQSSMQAGPAAGKGWLQAEFSAGRAGDRQGSVQAGLGSGSFLPSRLAASPAAMAVKASRKL